MTATAETDTAGIQRPRPTRPPVAQSARTHRGLLAAGLLTMVVSALLGGYLFSTRSAATTEVWVTATDIVAGEVISSANVRTTTIDAGADVTAIAASTDLAGRVAGVTIPAGSLLNPAMLLTKGDTFEVPDRSEVGLKLALDRVPGSLAAGDEILVVEIPSQNRDDAPTLTAPVPGTVAAVAVSDTGLGELEITVSVDRADAVATATIAGQGRAAIVITGRGN